MRSGFRHRNKPWQAIGPKRGPQLLSKRKPGEARSDYSPHPDVRYDRSAPRGTPTSRPTSTGLTNLRGATSKESNSQGRLTYADAASGGTAGPPSLSTPRPAPRVAVRAAAWR